MRQQSQHDRIMSALNTVRYILQSKALCGREGWEQNWPLRQALRSPRYTTRWEELPVVR